MTRHSALVLGSNPVVKAVKDERVIYFEETRFRSHALPFQDSLSDMALTLAEALEVELHTTKLLSQETEESLNIRDFCVFDFLDVRTTSRSGFLQAHWLPFVIFSRGSKVFAVKAAYDKHGAQLKGLTLFLNGKDESTPCTTVEAATRVGLSYIRDHLKTESK